MENAIHVDSLIRTFNGVRAVDDISFDVKTGELFGLLGPNGAGKTTTINILATLLRPTSGRGIVAGFDVTRDRDSVRRSIGIVFQEPALDTKLTGKENLNFHAMMYGIGKTERRLRIDEVLGLVELEEKSDVLVENYSGGMKRRLEIARGLIHSPQVLFLDEPTLGLDAQTRRRIWDYIKILNREKKVTIILTSHYMEEADYLCDRIAIMDYGKFVAEDTPQKLKDILGGDVISIEIEGDTGGLIHDLQNNAWVKNLSDRGNVLRLTVQKGERRIPGIIRLAQNNKVQVNSVDLHKPSLEDVFLHFTGRRIRPQEASTGDRNRDRMRGHQRRRR